MFVTLTALVPADAFIPIVGQGTQTIKIGSISATTPDLAGAQAIADIALEDVNKYMLDFRYPYRFERAVEDANGTEARHLEKVQLLHSSGVHFVLGAGQNSMASSSLGYCDANDVLLLSSSSTSASLAISGDNLFRLNPSDVDLGVTLAKSVWSYGIKYVCLLQRDDSWADGIYAAFDAEWRALGGLYVSDRLKYPTAAVLFNNYLDTEEQQVGAAASLYGTSKIGMVLISRDEAVTILREAPSLPYLSSVTWFGADTTTRNQNIIDGAGFYASQVHLYGPLVALEPTDRYSDIEARYLQKTGEQMPMQAACEYDWYWIIALAVVETGSADPMTVKESLLDVADSYIGASGRCMLHESGDRSNSWYEIWGYSRDWLVVNATKEGWLDATAGEVYWDSRVKPAISITCEAEPASILGGDSLSVTGKTAPTVSNTTVKMTFWDPDDHETEETRKTNATGAFRVTLQPPVMGIWHFQASWGGDAAYRNSTSAIGWFEVQRKNTSISIAPDKATILKGDAAKVTGQLTPPLASKTIKIVYTSPDHVETIRTVQTNQTGVFTDSYSFTEVGVWFIKAQYDGDDLHLGSVSSPVNVTVVKKPTLLNILLSKTSIVEGGNVSAYGRLMPPLPSMWVELKIVKPDKSTHYETVETDAEGEYSFTLSPEKFGTWTFKAYFKGSDTYLSSSSENVTLTVTRIPITQLKVYVKDNSAKPLAGATVTSTAQPSGQATLSGTTDAQGLVAFGNVKPGSYSFLVALEGYTSRTDYVDAPEDQVTERTIVIEKVQTGIPGFPPEAVLVGLLASLIWVLVYRGRGRSQPFKTSPRAHLDA
jgi:branched-chain amino acid transport system substrate-binding protein